MFTKALRGLETYLSLYNNLHGKLVSSLESPTAFYERFRLTSVPFFIPYFNLLSCKLDNFIFKVLLLVILYWYYIKSKWNYDTLVVPCKKVQSSLFFTSSTMKNIFACWSRFPVKLILVLLLYQHQVFLSYLNLLLPSYNILLIKNNLAKII